MIKKLLPLAMLAVLVTAVVPMPLQTQAQTEQEDFTLQVSVGEDSITRGSKQTVNVETDQKADIIGSITYASSFTRAFSGTTGDDNKLSYEWKIGSNSKPGTFAVKIIAISEDNRAAVGQTTFTVTDAQAPPVEEQETPEVPMGNGTGPVVDNGTITEGNGTAVIVPEEPVPINVTVPTENQTAAENITIPTINETIPIPVPVNTTTGNETIPVPIPVNSTTNQTVPVPELPTNETAVNETGPVTSVPTANETVPEPTENGTVIVTPENETVPVENGTIVCIQAPCPGLEPGTGTGNVTEPENQTLPVIENQTETLPDVIPINQTTGNVTEPIPIPINQTLANETIPVPPIDVSIPDNATLPAENVTAEAPPAAENGTASIDDIIADLDERTTVLENQSTSEADLFTAVGSAIEQMGNAVSIVPGLTDEEQAAVIASVNDVMRAVQNLH